MTALKFRQWTSPMIGGVLCALFLQLTLPAQNAYLVRNLVSDVPELADHTDPGLKGAWGISESPTSPFWIADAGTGLSTLYNSSGSVIPLVVTIPPSKGGGAAGVPTGTVFNGTKGFEVTPGNPGAFLFDSLDGAILAWNATVDRTHAKIMVDNSGAGAVYTGLAIGTAGTATFIYAANFHAATIEVYDSTFKPVTTANAFKDGLIPAGYAPFNVQNLGGKLYVAYALQNTSKSFSVGGAGDGYVDVFDTAGNLLQRLIEKGQLNAPWGLAMAPAGFGTFANSLLVGNFGDGTIHAYNSSTGAFLGTLNDAIGSEIVIPGLWALQVGNGGNGGDTASVYFTAGIPGPDNGEHGLFGRLDAAPAIPANGVANAANALAAIAPNTWIAIKGDGNLASTTRSWEDSDFVNGALPTVIDGVTVTINGKPAYISFVSPRQINVLTRGDTVVGPGQVQVNNNGLTSATANIQVEATGPAFFLLSDGKHVAATHLDGSLIGETTATSKATPAKPGETVVLYGNGFGPTAPLGAEGQVVTAPEPAATRPVLTIGGTQADLVFAGLSAAGLFQFNVTIPAGTQDGDVEVVAQVAGQTSPSALITVKQ